MFVSDIVLLKNLTEEQRNNEELITSCVGGALLKEKYLDIIKKAGFTIKSLKEDKDISKKQYQGLPIESLNVKLIK
jgi:ArsR family transcriptional regulator